jgi:hypothetical protein
MGLGPCKASIPTTDSQNQESVIGFPSKATSHRGGRKGRRGEPEKIVEFPVDLPWHSVDAI